MRVLSALAFVGLLALAACQPGSPTASTAHAQAISPLDTAQPGTAPLTPQGTLALQPTAVLVPPAYTGLFPTDCTVYLPPGWTCHVAYAGDLDKPRFLTWGPHPNGQDCVLYAANKTGGYLLAMWDRDHDGVADTAWRAATNLPGAHDVDVMEDTVFVSLERQVIRLWDTNADGLLDQRNVFIDNIAAGAQQPGGGHDTRTLVFDTANGRCFLSIGSYGNADRETERALINVYDRNGQNPQLWADGVRNAVGMALRPSTGRLWANNNGSDRQGDDIPPEWIDVVRQGAFYGYPIAYGYRKAFDYSVADYRDLLPITAQDTANLARMYPPAALITAHTAPMALMWGHDALPAPYQQGVFSVLRGSWNRSVLSGYKVVYLHFTDGQDTVADSVTDFWSGFLTDAQAGQRWARPVGLASDAHGRLYLSLDAITQAILVASPPAATPSSTPSGQQGQLRPTLYPNPANTQLNLANLPTGQPVELQLLNALGQAVAQWARTPSEAGPVQLPLPVLPAGRYTLAAPALAQAWPVVVQ